MSAIDNPRRCARVNLLMRVKFTHWQEKDGTFLGYLNDYPDHWTQGGSLEDLKEHLRDLHATFADESIPGIKREAELELA